MYVKSTESHENLRVMFHILWKGQSKDIFCESLSHSRMEAFHREDLFYLHCQAPWMAQAGTPELFVKPTDLKYTVFRELLDIVGFKSEKARLWKIWKAILTGLDYEGHRK